MVGIAIWPVDGSHKAIREEGPDAAGVAQSVDVDDLLGGAAEGQTPDVCGDVVDERIWYSDGAGVSVHQALVIRLHITEEWRQ